MNLEPLARRRRLSARSDTGDALAGASESPPLRILIVEDEKEIASFLRKARQAEGLAVDLLEDGNLVLAAVESTPFDMAVLDITSLDLAGAGAGG